MAGFVPGAATSEYLEPLQPDFVMGGVFIAPGPTSEYLTPLQPVFVMGLIFIASATTELLEGLQPAFIWGASGQAFDVPVATAEYLAPLQPLFVMDPLSGMEFIPGAPTTDFLVGLQPSFVFGAAAWMSFVAERAASAPLYGIAPNFIMGHAYDLDFAPAFAARGILRGLQPQFVGGISPSDIEPDIVVFSFMPNAAFDVTERYGYLSDVITSYDGTEQRVSLRDRPHGGLSFTITNMTAAQMQTCVNRVYSRFSRQNNVPLWRLARHPEGFSVGPGGYTIPIETASIPFEPGQHVVFWSDADTYRVYEIATVGDGTLTLTEPLDEEYISAATWVIPLVLGFLSDATSVQWETDSVGSAQVDFTIDRFPL